jgi:ribosomal protein L25 (general stress protein Ctc)
MDVELKVQVRTKVGKGPARRLRREEAVPAVLYGPKRTLCCWRCQRCRY